MLNLRNTIQKGLLIAVAALGIQSCSQEMEEMDVATGTLQLSLGQISVDTHTRAVPAELGVPLAEHFNLAIQRTGTTLIAYEGSFQESVTVKPGTYDVVATAGENVKIGRDAPFYKGETQVTVEKDKTASAVIPCRVANALVSVRFGRNDEETARFQRHYSNYGVLVKVGSESMAIGSDQTASSIYFPAGSSPKLSFFGDLRSADNRQLTYELNSEAIPDVFEEAVHVIVTLTLPDPETASVIDITTVEVETVSLEETIPLSWLPVPSVQPAHNYDRNGCLRGTDLTFTNSYPGMEWKVEVTDGQSNLLRSVEGTGELVSSFAANADGWPFLPAGQYTATFYLNLNGNSTKTGTRTFSIPAPDITVTTSAHTSYNIYLDGDVDGANACDPYTVYAPTVTVGIISSLWNNVKYSASLLTTLGGTEISDVAPLSSDAGLVFSFPDQKNITPSLDGCPLIATATFGQSTGQGETPLLVTGLPVEFAPPTQESWSSHGTVNWTDEFVRLGQNTTSQPQYVTTNRIAVPAGVNIRAPYSVMMHGASVSTTLTLSFGANVFFEETSSGGIFNSKDHYYEDVALFTTTDGVSEIKANNSYGSGQTLSRVYYLKFYYAE